MNQESFVGVRNPSSYHQNIGIGPRTYLEDIRDAMLLSMISTMISISSLYFLVIFLLL